MSVNSKLIAIYIIGQSKVFYRQKKIPESSYARKETVDIDTLVRSRNGDRKIIHLSEQHVDFPREWGSGANWASSNEHLSKKYL